MFFNFFCVNFFPQFTAENKNNHGQSELFFKQLIKANIDGKHTPISKLNHQGELKVIRTGHTQFFDVGKMSLYWQ